MQRRYCTEPRNIRCHPVKERPAEGGHEVTEEADREQEPECSISDTHGTALEHIKFLLRGLLTSSIAYRYLCQEWGLTFPGRDCIERVYGQPNVASQSVRSRCAKR